MTDINTLFQELSPEQEQAFRKWARENYEALDHIKDIWHPSVRDECNNINNELLAKHEQQLADKWAFLTEPKRQQLEDKIEYIKDQLV